MSQTEFEPEKLRAMSNVKRFARLFVLYSLAMRMPFEFHVRESRSDFASDLMQVISIPAVGHQSRSEYTLWLDSICCWLSLPVFGKGELGSSCSSLV